MNEQRITSASSIEWTRIVRNGVGLRGFTWNPVAGCQHGCRWTMPDGREAICYAENTAESGVAKSAYPEGFAHHYFHPNRLNDPLKVKEPAGIFLDSMSDLMGQWVPAEQIQQVLDVCAQAYWHTFQLLTKNAPRLRRFEFPPNVWVGVSSPPDFMLGRSLSRHQQMAMLSKSMDTLAKVDAPVRWISFEPLSWDVSEIVRSCNGVLQWAVVGAASDGRRYLPPLEADLRKLLGVLDEQSVKAFFKGNLRSLPWAAHNWREDFPD